MLLANMLDGIDFDDEDIAITELMRTAYSKEIRIAMQRHQMMRDHESSHPVAFAVLEGSVRVQFEAGESLLQKGDVLSLEREVVHHLEALEDTVLRLTIFLC